MTLIALIFSSQSYGQVTKDVYKNVNGLIVADSIDWTHIVGGFFKTDGLGGYHYRLDSNMTFQKISFSCGQKFKVDSGAWTIKTNNTVVLKSNKETLYFDIVMFGNFYFLVLPIQREKFIQDLQKTREIFKKAKPITFDGTTYSVESMIGNTLGEKYYAKEINDTTGT